MLSSSNKVSKPLDLLQSFTALPEEGKLTRKNIRLSLLKAYDLHVYGQPNVDWKFHENAYIVW